MTKPRVCVVTGATRGLGLALSAALAGRGHQVVMVCRDRERGDVARNEVAAGAVGKQPELLVADLADLGSIRSAAAQFRQTHDRLDVLVNNAAAYTRTRRLSADGYELMFATNHLGPFLLTNLLLDPLHEAAGARVLTVTAPSTVPVNIDDLQSTNGFSALRAFGASKMANLLFAFELARRGGALGITSNAVHPGLVRTQLMAESPALLRWATAIVSRPPRRAAEAMLPLALDDDYASVTGRLLKSGKPVATNAYSVDAANQAQLWRLSLDLAGLPAES
jgi:NAD(P)-dependent dehydrogenase (short-subunit alcohol dehydrogenase family)